ncbi:MAG: SdrD B-like domain-containing protein [Verrucomicrobiota bacterium]|nr:hypothetical protein [Limisphaerales bacterium]
MRRTAWLLVLCGATLVAAKSLATSFSSFGPQGAGGSKNGQVFQVGDGGTVFELDAFLAVNGFDLNGGSAGTSAQLSGQSLPTGLALGFSAALSDPADAVLTYVFTNLSSGSFTNLRFSVLLDAEVDQEFNTFFNEFGTVIGTLGNGAGDVTPDMWQIDEPGFVSGALFNNLFLGALNNSNSVPASAPNDVALGLGFLLGDLAPGQSAAVSVMISSAGHYLGTFALQQSDTASNSPGTITLSAIVSTLTGTIFKDQNTNGISDPGENLAGVNVLLLSGELLIAQTTTDSGGNYSFNSPPAGTYTVKVDATTLPSGLTNTVDPDGVLDGLTVTTLSPGQLKILNWGYQAPPGTEQFGDVSASASFGVQWRLKASTGTLLGTLSITNLPASGLTLAAPFQLGFPTSTNFWLAHPVGTLNNGLPYANVTAGVVAQSGLDGVLSPGERVVVVDAVEIYSRDRSAPPTGLFKLWATQRP